MINPTPQIPQNSVISETVVEALTAVTVAISGFLVFLVFGVA